MKFNLVTEQPLWWILLCLAAGIGYAILLYRNPKNPDGFSPMLKWSLFGLRALLVSFLAFLLLTPMIKTIARETEKPLLILAQDNSRSIVINKDSAYYREKYPSQVKEFLDAVTDKFDVKTVSWGDKVTDGTDYSYSEKETDFSNLMDELNIRFGNRNVGALIIASDGLYNRGSNPVYATSNLKVPVYTIALGDTIVRKDLLISSVNFNKVVFLGNSFPVEVNIDARQCNGSQAMLSVKQDSAQIFSKSIQIGSNRFRQVTTVILDAKKVGMQHFRIELSSLEGEITKSNNVRDIFIEVIERKQKIYLVGNAPHPDLGALKQALESNQNYSVKISTPELATDQLNEYNLLVLHNLPSVENSVVDLLKRAEAAHISILYILGAQTGISQFNALHSGIEITNSLAKTNIVQPAVNSSFSLFTISDAVKRMLPQFPPLLVPFGNYRSTTNTYTMLNQQIGSVSTDDPLIIFNESGLNKTGIICGEGIWRWRLMDYSLNGNFDAFNEIVNKCVQNLSIKEDRTHFRLSTKNSFAENEPVNFDAEVYNDNYELINTPDVNITILNADKKSFPYTFSKTDRAYTLNAGYLPSGDYRFKANVRMGDKLFTQEGQFSVLALQVEQTETVADHQLLYTLAHKNGGEMYNPSQLNELQKTLLARGDIKSVSYSHSKLLDLVNLKLIFFILLFLLSVEWFLRKRAGAY